VPPIPVRGGTRGDFCFGPLEVDYDLDAAAVSSRASPSRVSEFHLALRRTVTRSRRRARRPRGRLDAAASLHTPRRRTRCSRFVAEGRHPQPHRLVQGPRGVGGRSRAARRLGFTTAALCVNGQPRHVVAAHAASIGWTSVTIIPADLEKSRSRWRRYSEAPYLGSRAITTTSTDCASNWSPSTPTGPSST